MPFGDSPVPSADIPFPDGKKENFGEQVKEALAEILEDLAEGPADRDCNSRSRKHSLGLIGGAAKAPWVLNSLHLHPGQIST